MEKTSIFPFMVAILLLFFIYISYHPSNGDNLYLSSIFIGCFVILSFIYLPIKLFKIILDSIRFNIRLNINIENNLDFHKANYIQKKQLDFHSILFCLSILLVGSITLWNLQSLKNTAIGYLYQIAAKIQTECEEEKKCPSYLEDWKYINDDFEQNPISYVNKNHIKNGINLDHIQYKIYRIENTDFVFYYQVENNYINNEKHTVNQRFGLSTSYGWDSGYFLNGGVNKFIEVGRLN